MIDYSLKLTKVDKVIEIFPTVEQAIVRFAEARGSKNQDSSTD